MGNPDVSVFKTFFKGYKENYKQSMIGGIFIRAVRDYVRGLHGLYDD